MSIFSLTEKEKKRLDYKKKVLALAKDHKRAGEIEKVDRYVIPDADKVLCCYCYCGVISIVLILFKVKSSHGMLFETEYFYLV